VTGSRGRRACGGGVYPNVRAGIVIPASIEKVEIEIKSAPNDHFTPGPHCRML
jgi:hypothetical protein